MKNSKTGIVIGIVSVLIIVSGVWLYASGGEKTVQKITPVNVSSQGPFKYFQIAATVEPGIAGEILLNGERVLSFNKRGGQLNSSQINSNKAQELIKDGANSIELIVLSADAKDAGEALLTYAVEITLHALNEIGTPTKANEVLRTKWNPTSAGVDDVLYTFYIKKDRLKTSTDTVSLNTVTNSDKNSFANALENRKNLFATKDTKAIKTFYIKILPADTGIAKKTDSQILAMAERDLARLVQLPPGVFDTAAVEWRKTTDSIQAVFVYGGEEVSFSTKIIDGAQY